jgi:hypothetical protein
MKINFRKVLIRSLHGENFSLLWGLSDFCNLSPYASGELNAEENRIVAKVDELMVLRDELETRQKSRASIRL